MKLCIMYTFVPFDKKNIRIFDEKNKKMKRDVENGPTDSKRFDKEIA